LASEKKTVSADSSTASAERPILSSSKGQGLASSNNSRNSAAPTVITRSNNPYSYSKQENSKQDISKPKTRRSRSTGKQKETSDSSPPETKKQVEEAEPRSELKKLPPYLAFIVNGLYYIGSYPVAFVCKTYSVICFVISLPALTYAWLKYLTYELPLDCAEKSVKFAKEVPAKVLVWLANNLQGLIEICALYQLGGLCCIALAFWFCYQFVGLPFTNNMTYPLFSILRLVLGTLYPAYASYKAVRTKDVKEYVKWMMYWIVFAIFTSVETFADIFVAFWFPFYYEVKILLLIWLISPVSRGSLGSSILYRRFVHPSLIAREEEIDRMILRMQEQGYNTVTKLAVKGFNYASNMVMQTAIRGGGGLVHQLRKSYSLTDLGHTENDYGATITEHRAITSDPDEIAELEHRRRTGSASRSSGPVRYVRHISHDTEMRTDQAAVPRRRSSRSRDSPHSGADSRQQNRDVDEMSSSGYSSAINAEYYPVSTETMDTGDYELYDPRIHARPRLVQPRVPNTRVKTKEVSHYGTLPRSYSRKGKNTRSGILPDHVYNK